MLCSRTDSGIGDKDMVGSTDLVNQLITTIFGGFVVALGIFSAKMISKEILTGEQPKEIRSLLKGLAYFIYFISGVMLLNIMRNIFGF